MFLRLVVRYSMSSERDGPESGESSADGDGDGVLDNVSRRSLIKATLGGVIVAGNAYLLDNVRKAAAETTEPPGVRERFSNQQKLTVNGRTRFVKVEDQERLLETLRYKLGLTGSKFGCDRAMCGACTVLVDGEPIGVSTDKSYVYNVREFLSLAVIDTEYAEPGTEVTVVWGDPTADSPRVERHEQVEISATVAPAPYGTDKR